jgi:hypothetical protein
MTIYALFLCLQATAACHRVPLPRFALGIPSDVFASAQVCKQAASRYFQMEDKSLQGPLFDKSGRFYVQSGEWYECLERHIATWKRPQ